MTRIVQAVGKLVRLLVCGGMSLSVALSASAAEEPLAKLKNGEVITENDFNSYLARRVDLKPLARNFWGAENALREQLMTRLLVLEGIRLNEPYRGGQKPERFDDAYGLTVYQKLARACPKSVDASVAHKFFEAHPEAFTVPASVRLTRVMLPVSEKIDGMSTMAWLMGQAQEVAKGTQGFDKVVSRAETIYKFETQGDLGWVNLAGDVAIMRALADAKPGEMVGPVREGDFGYLFVLGDKREARVLKWDEVKSTAANRQISHCKEQSNKELSDKLYTEYGVVINNDAIKALFKIPTLPAPKAPAVSTPKK